MTVDQIYELIASWRLGQEERYTRVVEAARRKGVYWKDIARVVRANPKTFRNKFPHIR